MKKTLFLPALLLALLIGVSLASAQVVTANPSVSVIASVSPTITPVLTSSLYPPQKIISIFLAYDAGKVSFYQPPFVTVGYVSDKAFQSKLKQESLANIKARKPNDVYEVKLYSGTSVLSDYYFKFGLDVVIEQPQDCIEKGLNCDPKAGEQKLTNALESITLPYTSNMDFVVVFDGSGRELLRQVVSNYRQADTLNFNTGVATPVASTSSLISTNLQAPAPQQGSSGNEVADVVAGLVVVAALAYFMHKRKN